MPSSESVSLERLATAIVPLLSRSLAERFNVFRVMHHGTHEKQISNVFAWLLRKNGTHGFGDAFQQIFVELINDVLPEETRLPTTGYRVEQEVDTSGHDSTGSDIADIVLSCSEASIVVENYQSSDGHGHDYYRYLSYGKTLCERSVVVLMCARREPHMQRDGWEQAVVMTYADILRPLKAHVEANRNWRRTHPQQDSFIGQLFEHFLEGTGPMDNEQLIDFIKTMCETGESSRYGLRPHDVVAQEFAELLAQHAKRQFEEGRKVLTEIKRTLKRFARTTLVNQLNAAIGAADFVSVQARFVGQWEWCVTLGRGNEKPPIFIEFGPTAVVENNRAPESLDIPDYTRLFVTRGAVRGEGIDKIMQTDVKLVEVLEGLPADDTRLRDAVLATIMED